MYNCSYFSFSTAIEILVLASVSLVIGLEDDGKELDVACIEVCKAVQSCESLSWFSASVIRP